MNVKALLTILASIIYLFGANWWYNNYVTDCGASAAVPTTVPVEEVKEPLMFSWSDAKSKLSDKWGMYKASILGGMNDDNILEITGKYFKDEVAPPGFENMGLARAADVRKHFPEVNDTRIRMKAELVADRTDMRNKDFMNAAFNWVIAPKVAEEPKVIDLANKALIYFPFNSSVKEVEKEVDDYLKKLAVRLTQTTEKVVLTGHTDNIGDDASNMKLSERRAKFVQEILKKYGVAENRITVDWKGESQPVESNDTEKGRRLNRRTIIEIVQ